MTPLIFLPGMMCDARLYAPQITAIHGRTITVSPINQHDSIEALATEVLEHAPPAFALCGLSMGGIVAMEMVRQAAKRVTRLCLMDTNPLAETPAVKAQREPQMQRVAAGNLLEVMRDEMKPNYLADTEGRKEILDLCMDMALTLGDETFLNQSIALRDRPDQCDTLRRYQGYSLILYGESDRLCPADRHQLMHSLLPNSSLEVVPQAGHLPTIEQPDATSAALCRWLHR